MVMKSRHAQAFSLVELLVVVAIMVGLIALLIPTVGAARDKADSARCNSNLRNVYTAMMSYVADNDGFLPAVSPYNSGKGDWIPELIPYFSSYSNDFNNLSRASKIMICPTQARRIKTRYGYTSYHTFAMNFTLGPNASPLVKNKRRFVSLPQPSNTIMVTEAGYNQGTSIDCMQPYYIVQSATYMGQYLGGVHNGANNILWCDGHISAFANVKQLNPSGTDNGYGVGGSKDLYWSPQYDSSNW